MKRSVWITTSFEGLHQYPDAPDEVSFLRNSHRHIFHVRAEVQVMHNERDIEFIMLKRKIEKFIREVATGRNEYGYFIVNSCEDMAERIGEYIRMIHSNRCVSVEVSEDKENGAFLSWEENE